VSVVAVLKGGRSLERQVSLKTGARVEEALTRLGHEVIPIDVGPDLVEQLGARPLDVAFIALHGGHGEDGTIQGLLEVLGIPYTGSRVSGCVRASDKLLTKHLLIDHGIPTPDFVALREGAFDDLGAARALPQISSRLSFPLVVKPASQGSALGIKFAGEPEHVPTALLAAFSYGSTVLLERYVAGRELAVSILTDEHGTPEALPIVEAVPVEEDFFNFEARYEIGRTQFVCPAHLEPELAAMVSDLALRAFSAVGCSVVARVDLILERDTGIPYVLEINSIPGMTELSLLPQAADAAGIDFDALIARIVSAAL
jgi:D-alanine-D-alanine ligase